MALDDPRLNEGFHEPEAGHRWTAGRERLPAALMAGLSGTMFLRLDLVGPRVPHWIAPEEVEGRQPGASDARAA